MIKPFLLGLMALLLSQKVLPQESKEVANRVNSGKIFTTEQELKEWIKLCGNDTVRLYSNLARCKIDSLPEDKLTNSIYLLKSLAVRQSSGRVKKAAVVFFLASAKSKYSGVSSLSVKALNGIPSRYFENASIDSISSFIINYSLLYKDAVLLAGYIGNPIFIDRIKSVFPSSRNFSKQERWATYKALARLGDKEALDFCVKRVSSLPLSDQVIDALYPDLIYTHKREAFEVMIKALFSDENLCSSSNPNSDSKILCGYRVMELLAPEIVDFPIKALPSGDLDVKDYKKALVDVRDWFNKNRDIYVLE